MSIGGIDSALAYGGAVLGSVILTPVAIKLARTLGVVDLPNARKVHQSPVPRCGGLAIALAAVFAAVPLLITVGNQFGSEQGIRLATLLGTSLFVLAVGLLDDLVGVPSARKLAALVLAAVVFCGSGARIESIFVRQEMLFSLGWFSWPVTIFWIVGVTVGINFIDGLDGLAAGIAGIASLVLGIASLATGQVSVAIIAFALAGSLGGFLLFNFHPAKVFMGDCGSMFLGFTIAASGVLCSSHAGTTPGILLPALALIIPAFDTLFTLIRRRILQRRSIFAAERGHIHHRLLDMGLRHPHVVLLLYGVSLVSGTAGLLLRFANVWLATSACLITAIMVVVLFRTSGSSRARDTVLAIRRNRAISREWRRYRQAFEDAQLRFRNAIGFEAWWREVCTAAEILGFVSVTLPLVNRDGTPRVQRWHHPDTAAPAGEIARATLPIRHRRSGGPLRAEVEVDAHQSLESAGHRIALFSRLMGEHNLATLPAICVDTTAQSSHADPLDLMDEPAATTAVGATRLRVAIVHDFLYTYAGAERVLEQILNVYPDADLFSLFDFLPEGERHFIRNKVVKTSFIQRMPFARRKHRLYLPLMPLAIEQLDVSNYDLVISSSYLAAKGVITKPTQLHVCYCHTPVRFAWDMQGQYLSQGKMLRGPKSLLARSILHYIRSWDVRSANGVDVFVTNSRFVGQRVQKVYRRESSVIYPPVNTSRFTAHAEKEDFYLTASRLVPYKRIDVIIEAFNRVPDKKLIVVGDGPEMDRLKAIAGANVRLLGQQPAERLRRYLQLARGFVFAAEEDFGIAPVEAQACGTPVLAFGRGGVLESIVPGKTGLFFEEQTPQSIVDALTAFEKIDWDAAAIRRNAENFSHRRFRDQFRRLVEREWAAFSSRQRVGADSLHLADQLLDAVEGAQLAGFGDPTDDGANRPIAR
jgi:UDP-N-acetylmuramyl pentapeptide phosphotransferase/UDP-N-acetylglucosamine-1-phosphate transferase/glycosyltransferase involved in cell wall biosynthesis